MWSALALLTTANAFLATCHDRRRRRFDEDSGIKDALYTPTAPALLQLDGYKTGHPLIPRFSICVCEAPVSRRGAEPIMITITPGGNGTIK